MSEPPQWHAALTFAVLGRTVDGLGEQDRPDLSGPDLSRLAAELEPLIPGGLPGLRREVAAHRASGAAWPHPVPTALRAGLGPAQFAAALAGLLNRLGLGSAEGSLTVADRPLSPAERRLAEDVPPHHG